MKHQIAVFTEASLDDYVEVMVAESQLPDYEKPPVVETVFSAQFDPLNASTLHLAQFWGQLRPKFLRIVAQLPLPTVIEPDALTANLQPITIALDHEPRAVIASLDDTELIQIQRDRFIFNWRRQPLSPLYPRFKSNFETFRSHLRAFTEFCETEGFGQPSFNQFELTYVNLIDESEITNRLSVGALFVDHKFESRPDRFLSLPETTNWNSTFQLPNGNGRLYINAHKAFVPNVSLDSQSFKPVFRIDLTARGWPTSSLMTEWFELAHSWVVRGFADIIEERIQVETWGKKL